MSRYSIGSDTRYSLPEISVVVPVYNSHTTILELVTRIENVLSGDTNLFEIIIVNDGSSDNSWDVIREITLDNDRVHAINLTRNYGQHNALLCGIREAKYPITITIDDDLQNPPEEMPKLLEKLEEGYDVVYGYPKRLQQNLWRRIASVLSRLVLRPALGTKVSRHVSSFRAFSTNLRDSFSNYQGSFVFIDILLTWATTRFGSIAVRHDRRIEGRSNYNFRSLVTHAVNMLSGLSILPLKLSGLVGLLLSFFGFGVLIYVLLVYIIWGASVPGFTFLASIISIFSGAQMLALGIIGEYLGRMHLRLMNRPAYYVGEQIVSKADQMTKVGKTTGSNDR